MCVCPAGALLIMEETQFLSYDTRKQRPSSVMPLDEIVTLLCQGFIIILVEVVQPHSPLLVATDRGPEESLAWNQQRHYRAVISACVGLVHIAAEIATLGLDESHCFRTRINRRVMDIRDKALMSSLNFKSHLSVVFLLRAIRQVNLAAQRLLPLRHVASNQNVRLVQHWPIHTALFRTSWGR